MLIGVAARGLMGQTLVQKERALDGCGDGGAAFQIETADMEAHEWKARAKVCDTVRRHLSAIHDKLESKYWKGLTQETARTRLQ